MKGAFDSYLMGNKGEAEATPEETPDFESMFGEQEGEEAEDPLMSALASAGYNVDPEKLDQIRSILEPREGEAATPFGGQESSEEEALEGGAIPAKPKAGKLKM